MDEREFGEYFKQLRIKSGYESQRKLSEVSGISNGTIARIENGTHKPHPETLGVLSMFLKDTDYLDLMFRAGYLDKKRVDEINDLRTSIKGKEVKERSHKYGYLPNEEESLMIELPVLGTIRAGQPIDRIEYYEGTYPVLKKTINGYDAFWLKVKGESMAGDEIHDGDLVCIIVTTEVNPSDITAVAINGDEATLKRIKFLDGKCILTPSNRNMEPMIYPADKVHIIGKVVGFQRYYK